MVINGVLKRQDWNGLQLLENSTNFKCNDKGEKTRKLIVEKTVKSRLIDNASLLIHFPSHRQLLVIMLPPSPLNVISLLKAWKSYEFFLICASLLKTWELDESVLTIENCIILDAILSGFMALANSCLLLPSVNKSVMHISLCHCL